ncbi:hypothetical protein MMC28_002639 [Mycoblastus sanguinarius]|nr:hypothetical protein [Mycoblastus sanguinarius]
MDSSSNTMALDDFPNNAGVPANEGAATPLPTSLVEYTFPVHRLQQRSSDPSKTPLVLVACGSFSPVTFLHLRMFEMAKDFVRLGSGSVAEEFEVVGGFLSPVSDSYKKAGLASAHHRLRMCQLAVQNSDWISCDAWEPLHKSYIPTAQVLDHFDYEINKVLGGILGEDGHRRLVRVALLAGADLIQSFSTPGVWSSKDLDHILGRYGTFVVERAGTDIENAIGSLSQYEHNIWTISQLIPNEISSTKIRLFLKRDMSVRYLIPREVIQYIEDEGLYTPESTVEDGGSLAYQRESEAKGKTVSQASKS